MNPLKTELQKTYLDYVNNFITVERFAEYYEITEEEAQLVIMLGRIIHKNSLKEL